MNTAGEMGAPGDVDTAANTMMETDLNSVDKNKQDRNDNMSSIEPVKIDILWGIVLFFVAGHLSAIYGLYLAFTSTKLPTTLFGLSSWIMSGLGVTAGLHRLWSHKSYKAKWPLRFILMLMSTMAFEVNHIYEWCMDHRIHHKYTDTNSDPHNAKRGFFFSHVGWLVVRRHPDYYDKCLKIDMSDLKKDSIVMFQKTFYVPLLLLICFFLPTIIPVYFWNETYVNAFFTTMLRYIFTLNMTWLVNSAAHIWGQRPYDASINPSENLSVSLGALGEGWHNYHHVFPWDYKAAELGNYRANLTTAFIDFFSLIGWAYDMKTVSNDMILKRANRTGDGSHPNGDGIWGWDDSNISTEDRNLTTVINKKDD
ncbi:hypothetical protein AGLY_001625 [Aphis glycines]|uniref:Fatty acid desaturase domain-containing protein n=1 Tax=Aphis glycines TaxID=307491 RepID=A0A6G0U899_APHGL|nr:hypothetical protein AGLY_001625 [Aphis glycines]